MSINCDDPCKQEEICGCKTKISTLCVVNEDKTYSNIGSMPGDNGSDIIQDIDDTIGNITDRILVLEGSDSEITVVEFTGGADATITLPTNALRILNVFYDGINLSSDLWAFNVPNQVTIDLTTMGFNREFDDVIRVEYVKNLI